MNRYQTTFATWDKIAPLYQEYFMDLDLYNDTYDNFCDQLKPNASLLEIGCGPGNITRYLLSRRKDLLIEATDISPNMIGLAKQNVPAANFSLLDARDIDMIKKKFDGIVCGFCIPYLSKEDVGKLVKDCFSLLNEQGLFYCSAIAGNYNQSGFESGSTGDKAYVYYYEPEYVEALLLQDGFAALQTIRKQYNKKDGRSQTHIIWTAQKPAS